MSEYEKLRDERRLLPNVAQRQWDYATYVANYDALMRRAQTAEAALADAVPRSRLQQVGWRSNAGSLLSFADLRNATVLSTDVPVFRMLPENSEEEGLVEALQAKRDDVHPCSWGDLFAVAFDWRDEHGEQWVYHRDDVRALDVQIASWMERADAAEAEVEELRRERDEARGQHDAIVCDLRDAARRLSEYVEALRDTLAHGQFRGAIAHQVEDHARALLSQETETP